MKELKIFSLMFFPPANQFVITLVEETESRIIPIWIGIAEGNALHLKMKKTEIPRPLTHDLLLNSVESLGAAIQRVIINDLKNNTYYALLEITKDEETVRIDSRPSDALVLAVSKNLPIFIEEKVLSQCPLIPKPISQEDIDNFKDEMAKMTPEDFFRELEEGQ